ncbi:MAG: bifunctional phosphopantothenoylcysteine decarboxylase/phosphopantothenate--cysteine ligase CoaBC [Candidatus Krumholzibacteria bacterium]|nr:bifunctional phosphopantothenoylcysteine decarboxylase/phosphopantothenate--cysteine ligase CoaBC [Candidatus Krumholzibacteria bacterium]
MSSRGRSRTNAGAALAQRKILCIVTGGISAYKSAWLVRLLVRRGASVRVLMTAAAQRFVAPLTFEVLSGNPVPLDMFAPRSWVEHVDLAQWAERIVVAPATADFIGRIAAGLADDLPAAAVCAARCPVLIAPAMNDGMWANPAVRRNIERLVADGRTIIDPGTGELACGTEGTGRMAEPEEIAGAVEASFGGRPLEGVRVLITAGRTEEDIDRVRYISNRSSGRMGFALARRALELGARVTLVHGPADLPAPAADEVKRVGSAAEMRAAVMQALPRCDILVMAAAVADFTPSRTGRGKMRRSDGPVSLELSPTGDILAGACAKRRAGQIMVGFALEESGGEAAAKRKLRGKGCDYIVLNTIGPRTGFGAETNRVTVFRGTAKVAETAIVSKDEAAAAVFDALLGDSRLRKAGS